MQIAFTSVLKSPIPKQWAVIAVGAMVALSLAFGSRPGQAQAPASAALPTAAAAKAYQLPPDKLAKAIVLGRIRPALHFSYEGWELTVLLSLLASGGASRLARLAESRTRRRWLQGLLVSVALVGLIFFTVDLPIAAIGHAISLHYGISIEAWPSWLLDRAKMLALAIPIESGMLWLAFALMQWRWSCRRAWFWFACITAPLMLIAVFLLPPLIEPFFETYEPLAKSHPALVLELERVVARTGTSIPPERMFLMKAQEKTNGLNAYVSGLGSSKRIVVWDTTADRMPTDEVLFIFAHETGHYVLNHIAKGLAVASVGIFAFFWATARVAAALVRRFGRRWSVSAVSSLPGLAALLLAFVLLQDLTEPLGNLASRYAEHEADVFGQEAIHGIVSDPRKTAVSAFDDLGTAYLDDPNPNPFVAFWTFDHPSTQRRATFARQYDPWIGDRSPRFFPKDPPHLKPASASEK